jgi:hypothetical protein
MSTKAFRREKGEAKLRVQKSAAADEALARVFAVGHPVDAAQISLLVLLGVRTFRELPRTRLRILDALGRCRVRGEKVRRARIDMRLSGGRLEV